MPLAVYVEPLALGVGIGVVVLIVWLALERAETRRRGE